MRAALNIALKTAIFESRKKQKRVAKLAHISETQLSHIVRGRRGATKEERERLSGVLNKSVDELFPPPSGITVPPVEIIVPVGLVPP